jgi:3-mercaptopyruvate sulfurtransferase SseA
MEYEDVKKGLEEHSFLLIDVRNPEELQKNGKIPGSINIPCKYFIHIY